MRKETVGLYETLTSIAELLLAAAMSVAMCLAAFHISGHI